MPAFAPVGPSRLGVAAWGMVALRIKRVTPPAGPTCTSESAPPAPATMAAARTAANAMARMRTDTWLSGARVTTDQNNFGAGAGAGGPQVAPRGEPNPHRRTCCGKPRPPRPRGASAQDGASGAPRRAASARQG
ncbi:unnamed protein product [Prorocentrum cordatum]|uniref:Uncharacterized protein n=1 Tax=Prorocentrum cordatum TaxID=2364126 RepID=A0ABN9UQP6_9DINO|nr:unnamed protein product [Polarella glacialis]